MIKFIINFFRRGIDSKAIKIAKDIDKIGKNYKKYKSELSSYAESTKKIHEAGIDYATKRIEHMQNKREEKVQAMIDENKTNMEKIEKLNELGKAFNLDD